MIRRLVIIIAVLAAICGIVAAVVTTVLLRQADLASQQSGLDEERQKEIWAAEHATFRLETRFGKPFAAALAVGDASQAVRFFRAGFSGQWSPKTDDPGERVAHFHHVASSREQSASETGDAAELFARLRLGMAGVSDVERIRLRVLHIKKSADPDSVPPNPTESQGTGADEAATWTADLLLTVFGRTSDGQLGEYASHHQAVFRLPSEGFVDAVVEQWRLIDERQTVSSDALMEEVTKESGLDTVAIPDNWKLPVAEVAAYRFQTAVADFDQDGWLDIAVGVKRGSPLLLRGGSDGRFENVGAKMGIQSEPADANTDCYLAVWIDFDNDGDEDLLLGDRLYRNEAGERFEDITTSSDLYLEYSPKGCVVADYDCDGLLDLYILHDHTSPALVPVSEKETRSAWVGDGKTGAPNQLWKNLGDGRFLDVTGFAKAEGGPRRSHAASWFFFNDDRFPDLYIVNDFGPNVLLVNRGDGVFDDKTEEVGIGDFSTSMGIATGDLDNDGAAEIYVANMYSKMGRRIIDYVNDNDYDVGVYQQIQGSCAGNRLYWLKDGRYQENSELVGVNNVGWAYAPAMFDVDNDGLLDLYATSGYLSFERSEPDG